MQVRPEGKSQTRHTLDLLAIAVLLSPIAAFFSRALNNQQADNLLPSFFSTDHLTWFYWDQSRYGSIHSFLTYLVQNIHWNLVLQVHLRVASFLFFVFWTTDILSYLFDLNIRRVIYASITGIFTVLFLLLFPESGDALLYGANAHPIAIPFAVLGVSLGSNVFFARSAFWKYLLSIFLINLFWMVAIWTSIFTSLWAPAFILLQVGYLFTHEKVVLINLAIWLTFQAGIIAFWTYVFSEIAKKGGENTTFNSGLFMSEAIGRLYIFIPLTIYGCAVALWIALSVHKGLSILGCVYFFASLFFVMSIPIIASSSHVHMYSFMPRYFGVQSFAALLIIFSLCVSLIDFPERLTSSKVFSFSSRNLRNIVLSLSIIGAILTANVSIGFGSGKVDASGFVNTGQHFPKVLEEEISSLNEKDIQFVAGSYWLVWPIVFEMRSRGNDVIAVTKKASNQSEFHRLYDAKPLLGICVGESIKCWGSTINAKLNGVQLFSRINKEIVAYLQDGTPIRLMLLSKYPIRDVER